MATSPLIYAPFSMLAVYAIVKGKEWIRVPMLLFSTLLFYSLTLIMVEELWGPYATPNATKLLLAYSGYWCFPLMLAARFAVTEHPFTTTQGYTSATARKQKAE